MIFCLGHVSLTIFKNDTAASVDVELESAQAKRDTQTRSIITRRLDSPFDLCVSRQASLSLVSVKSTKVNNNVFASETGLSGKSRGVRNHDDS